MSVVDTLTSVTVGAIIGAVITFLSSMGFEWLKEWRTLRREKADLKGKISEELELVQNELELYQKKEIESRVFSTEVSSLEAGFCQKI